MLKRANIQWSAKTLKNQIDKGQLTFDCAVQRKPVWDLSRSSLLIHTMIEGYSIPAFYFVRNEEGKYVGLDGQQRSLAICGYMDLENGFALSEDTPAVKDEHGYPVEIAKLKFSELPEWAQDNIKDYSLTIYYFDDITADEIAEQFYRINNGKPLTGIEMTRVKAKSLLQYQDIARHPMIAEAITDVGKRRYYDESIAMQAWMLCFTEKRDLTTKSFRPFIETAEVTNEQIVQIKQALDYLKSVCDGLNVENKEDKRVLRKITTRTHLVSCIYLAMRAINKSVPVEEFSKIIYTFFDSKQTSIDAAYNKSVGSGSAKPDRVISRIQALNALVV